MNDINNNEPEPEAEDLLAGALRVGHRISGMFGLEEKSRSFFSGLEGLRVLEVGSGIGSNLKVFSQAQDLVMLEPDPGCFAKLNDEIRSSNLQRVAAYPFTLEVAIDSGVVVEDSFDVVVCSFVLCSVPDPDQFIEGAVGLLRRGGRMLFMEHAVPRNFVVANLYRLLSPYWGRYTHGCHLDFMPQNLSKGGNGWMVSSLKRFSVPLGWPIFPSGYQGEIYRKEKVS